jgi:hypothetical protein
MKLLEYIIASPLIQHLSQLTQAKYLQMILFTKIQNYPKKVVNLDPKYPKKTQIIKLTIGKDHSLQEELVKKWGLMRLGSYLAKYLLKKRCLLIITWNVFTILATKKHFYTM